MQQAAELDCSHIHADLIDVRYHIHGSNLTKPHHTMSPCTRADSADSYFSTAGTKTCFDSGSNWWAPTSNCFASVQLSQLTTWKRPSHSNLWRYMHKFAEEGRLHSSLGQKKSWNFAFIFWGHLKGGIETPQNDFQIYRPINDPRQAVLSLAGDIGGGISKNRFRAITFDWRVLRT